MIGVNGTVAFSCTTPVNGTCDTPFVAHAGNLLFQCLVATGNGSPVTAGSAYVFAVQRQPAALEADGDEAVEIDGASGLAARAADVTCGSLGGATRRPGGSSPSCASDGSADRSAR